MVNTFSTPLMRARRCYPDQLAMIDGDRQFTFGELANRIERLGGALTSAGLQPGDRVAILAENSHQYVELYVGLPAAGLVPVPLNTRHALPELEATIRDCNPSYLFTDREESARPGLGDLVERVVPMGQAFDALISDAPTLPLADRVDENDLAVLFYTGGTTGRSKGVMLSHRNKLCDALSVITSTNLTVDDKWLISSPMFHAAGTFNILPCLWVGAAMVILPKFDATEVLETIEQNQITITFGVPTMLVALTREQKGQGYDLSSLRLLGHGAAPITAEQLVEVCGVLAGVEIMGMYGATEMAPMATTFSHQERTIGSDRFKSCGRPVLGVDVRVTDDDTRELPPGEIGEICVRGPNLMLGYWNQPDQTAAAVHDGVYHSGDLGFFDDEGLLYIVDRKKDMIITGGENVYSTEVENVIAAYEGVHDVAVVGVPDEVWGELVCAVVVAEQDLDPAAIRQHCRRSLAGYKVPKRVKIQTDDLPRSPAGKVLKRTLRQILAEVDTR